MRFLPSNLAPLANVADKSTMRTFAAHGVHVRLYGDATFVAEATDGKVALRVSGDSLPCGGQDFGSEIGTAPNGNDDALVSAKDWKKIFSDSAKLVRKLPAPQRAVAVVLSSYRASFATQAPAPMVPTIAQVGTLDGRFPNVANIIPDKGSMLASITVDVDKLIVLLESLANIAGSDNRTVQIELHGKGKPMVIRSSEPGLRQDGLIAPVA